MSRRARAGGKRGVRPKAPRQSHGTFRDKDGNPVPDGHGGFLPKNCECGGLLDYAFSFNRIWSVCLSCTPVTKVTWNKRGTVDVLEQPTPAG
jgi:hypothetical protein